MVGDGRLNGVTVIAPVMAINFEGSDSVLVAINKGSRVVKLGVDITTSKLIHYRFLKPQRFFPLEVLSVVEFEIRFKTSEASRWINEFLDA